MAIDYQNSTKTRPFLSYYEEDLKGMYDALVEDREKLREECSQVTSYHCGFTPTKESSRGLAPIPTPMSQQLIDEVRRS